MPPAKLLNDYDLTARHIAELENSDQVIRFFALLGYDVDHPQLLTHASLSMDTDDLEQRVREIRRIAADPDEEIEIILFEVRSVTVALTQTIAQRFRQRPGNYLLVLTSDYETIDFVLLERIKTEGRGTGGLPRYVIRPRILTVNRRNPGVVALRVLKRFTFTEADALYQWDKLRSAYSLAEWSEPDFNNRALFSDYYLKNRVKDDDPSSLWNKDKDVIRRVGSDARSLLAGARERLTKGNEQKTRVELIEPLFALMGFAFTAHKSSSSSAEEPDYFLYTPEKRDQPIALALTYKWNRNLDSADPERDRETPDENPGALVVSLLEKSETQWVIMTNGKLWRLYSATASNKITNYYEIDLEEALFAPERDRDTAFKYWWLMFRREAFIGFLDRVLVESQDYAKQISERLKDRIFKHIFGYFASGFIVHMRGQGMGNDDIDLDLVFNATMTFLYRLMFVLYAESLELVPVKEENGYGAQSVKALKGEIADYAGKIIDQADDALQAQYGDDSTDLYDRLRRLFASIDQGDHDINLPVYNGGLFSPESKSGTFLEQYAIPDVYLAIGLDQLARDVDDKTHELVFIDFKSLGVRQLGSIYEGLLEFKLRVAREELAVVKDGKREVYMPRAQAVKEKKNILDTVRQGRIYIENTKQERKATGSYYTPDYIVKYIVQHTVGPVLDEKFAALRPRLHTAQKAYRQSKAVAEKKHEDPEKFWELHDPHSPMSQLADDCLSVRVLDPAMGSGHFLVEVVDYVSNRLIDFLNAWSENPVWALLERTRADILADMERQGVSIDESKLTRVVLLKRSVLKRCVYGVDLNDMAVELAKVSLWLDAFTLGAPLSFLDHHLKWGNSLIGARVEEVRHYLRGGEGPQQIDMFSGSEFAGIMLATDLMRQVSYLSDNTVSQVQRSVEAYHSASDHLVPFKRLLDVYTSRWFGNAPTGKKKTDNVKLFMKQADVKAWLKDPDSPLDDRLIPATAIGETAVRSAEEKRFFHWELEFPEVFFAPSTPGGQDVQLRKDGGFDAVVGNPPYDEFSEEALGRSIPELAFFEDATFATAALGNRVNIYRVFVSRAVDIVRSRGRHGFIVPMSILSDSFTLSLRRFLLHNTQIETIEAFPQKDDPYNRIFFDAKLSTCVYILYKEVPSPNREVFVRTHPGKDILVASPCYNTTIAELLAFDQENLSIPTLSEPEWRLCIRLASASQFQRLGDIAHAYPGELMINTSFKPYLADMPNEFEIVRGAHINPYYLSDVAKQGESLFLLREKYLREHRESEKAKHHQYDRVVYQRYAAIDNYRRLIATTVPAGKFCSHTVGYLWGGDNVAPDFLLAMLNSTLLNWRFNVTSTNNNINGYEVEALPVLRISFTTPRDQRNQFVNQGRSLYTRSLSDGPALVLAFTAQHLEHKQTDVIHDLLAFLAQQMIDFNKRRQTEIQRFLGWLEARLDIRPDRHGETGIDSLKKKTYIQNYLGDYQRGEEEAAFGDFYFWLHDNRTRFGVPLASIKAELEDEYLKSLDVLLPIKHQLAHTDALINRIVYQLYGLTEEEIRLIEYPALEQAVSTAREETLKEKDIEPSSDEAVEKIAEKVEQAAVSYFARVDESDIEARLRAEIAGWDSLPEKVRLFLLTGELTLVRNNLPEYSGVAISFAKAAETILNERLFLPFRAAGYTDHDCNNPFFQRFMAGGKSVMLGSMEIILASSDEPAFRSFVRRQYPDADKTIFARDKLLALLERTRVEARNGAAHDGVLTIVDAEQTRHWAVEILGYV